VTDYEVSFLRLLEKVTNGSIIEISYTGERPNYDCRMDCLVSLYMTFFLNNYSIRSPSLNRRNECLV